MPNIFSSSDLKTTRAGAVNLTTLANRDTLGVDALQVERVQIAPGARTEPASVSAAEYFLYVIRGAGRAQVGDQTFPLEAESVLWLESGDTFWLEAGHESLEVLLCRAPAL